MPDPLDAVTVAVVIVVLAMIAIAFFEFKFLRKSMRGRRVRAAKRLDELPDDAHNALITTKAIASTLERGGLHSEEVAGMLREAQMAYDRHNYRVVVDLTSKAREKLTSLKARQATEGDLMKLDSLSVPAREEPTTKEVLQKEFPPNLVQAKFTMELAEAAIEQGRAAGRDMTQAEAILVQARARFEGKDYTDALTSARQAHRSAEGGPISGIELVSPPELAETAFACGACGAVLGADDAFCRKCGTKVVA